MIIASISMSVCTYSVKKVIKEGSGRLTPLSTTGVATGRIRCMRFKKKRCATEFTLMFL